MVHEYFRDSETSNHPRYCLNGDTDKVNSAYHGSRFMDWDNYQFPSPLVVEASQMVMQIEVGMPKSIRAWCDPARPASLARPVTRTTAASNNHATSRAISTIIPSSLRGLQVQSVGPASRAGQRIHGAHELPCGAVQRTRWCDSLAPLWKAGWSVTSSF